MCLLLGLLIHVVVASPFFEGALVTGLANVAPNVGEGAALPDEGVLGAALTEEVSVVVLAEEVLVVALTEDISLAVLAEEVLCTEPVGGVPPVVLVLGCLLRLVYTAQGQLGYVGDP